MAKNEHGRGRPFATSGDATATALVLSLLIGLSPCSLTGLELVLIFFLDKTFDGHFIPSWSLRFPDPREQADLPKKKIIFTCRRGDLRL